MPGYTFPQAHASALETYTQRLTFAAPRNAGSTNPHAELGQPVKLSTGAHGGRRRVLLPPRRCILRAQAVLTADGLLRVIDLRRIGSGRDGVSAEHLERRLLNAEHGTPYADQAARDALAVYAGFADWPALHAYASHRDHRGRPDAEGRVLREVVGWSKADD